ncbi:flippase [Vibrio renipiscarius]|uniref:flippase n=1 Tax=Vibrio renipiscarius TaxID=1461322 RepID=UPI00069BB436|nr:flippase [Vibrio renipiscarius]
MNSFTKLFFGTASLQFLSRGLSVVSGVIFARFLGAEQYGLYTYVFSIITIAGLPVLAGIPNLMVREVANFHLEKNWPQLNGIIWWSRWYVLAASAMILISMMLLIHYEYFQPHVAALLFIAIWAIPLRGIASQQDAVLNGFRKPILAQLPSKLLAPVVTLAVLVYFVAFNKPLSSMTLVTISVLALVATCGLSYILVRLVIKKNSEPAKSSYMTNSWLKSLVPFALITCVITLNAELALVLLGWLGALESVAYFRVAMQAVMLITIVLSSIDAVLMPNIARLYKSGDMENTQALLSRAVMLTVFVSLPIFLVLVFAGDTLISLLFGEEYLSAYPALIILCVGHFFSIQLGSVGLVLNMTNNERKTVRSLAIALVINLILLFTLVPLYQEIGAAIAVALSLVICNLLMTREVWKLTHLRTWLWFGKVNKQALQAT